MDAEYYTLSETARALHAAESTVRLQADRGELPCIRVGPTGLRLFAQDAIRAIAATRQAERRALEDRA